MTTLAHRPFTAADARVKPHPLTTRHEVCDHLEHELDAMARRRLNPALEAVWNECWRILAAMQKYESFAFWDRVSGYADLSRLWVALPCEKCADGLVRPAQGVLLMKMQLPMHCDRCRDCVPDTEPADDADAGGAVVRVFGEGEA